MAQSQFPIIAPLPQGVARPFWSVMIPTYNRTKYLERTLKSVLDQAPGPEEMQIEVVDNASTTDEIRDLVQRVGGDRIQWFRQEQNLGFPNNWNTCIERSRGHWIHILHDDDVVQSDFYKTFRQFIESHSTAGMVFCRSVIVDEEDEWQGLLGAPSEYKSNELIEDSLFRMITDNPGAYLRCPAVVIARQAYESAGGYDPKVIFSVDWQMYMRIANQVEVGYLSRPLALYRVHQNSVTNDLAVRYNVARDFENSLACGIALLSKERREEARQKSLSPLLLNVRGVHALLLERPDVALRYSRYIYRKERSVSSAKRVFIDIARLFKRKLLKRFVAKKA